MNSQIKQRIEKIKNGKVPDGYKRTKVGIVPDEWKETKLSNYLEVSNDKNTNLKYGKNDVFSISGELGVVNQIELLGRSYAGASVAQYGIVCPNDIVYTKSPLKANPYGIIKTNKSGKYGIVSTLYAIFHCKDNVLPDYVQLYFDSNQNLNNYLYPIVNIGAKHDMKISDENSLMGNVVFPPLAEQKKIAEILATQDKIIELKERKIEELKKLKKYYLNKMFPKKGTNYPEVRFPGFTDPWEQRKLSEIATMHARIGWQNLRTSEFLDSGNYMLITGTDFEDGAINFDTCHYVERERYEQDKHIQIKNGSILITKDGTLGKVAYVQGLSMPATLNAGVFNVEIKDETKVDNKYLFQYLKAPYLMDYVDKKATGGTIKHLNQNILVDFPVVMPLKQEQRLIGAYFNQLDNLITLHQRELDEEKKFKKSLMQLLLKGIVRV